MSVDRSSRYFLVFIPLNTENNKKKDKKKKESTIAAEVDIKAGEKESMFNSFAKFFSSQTTTFDRIYSMQLLQGRSIPCW